MIIANDIGPVSQAWLEGESLDETCHGMRFRLLVGDAGGIVCDLVWSDRDLSAAQIESLATQAVINTDPLDNPLPIVDDNGKPARIVADPVHIEPVSRIIRESLPTEPLKVHEIRLINPLAAIALVTGNVVALMGWAWIGIPVALLAAVMLVKRMKILPHVTESINVAADRERERRQRMPDSVTTT